MRSPVKNILRGLVALLMRDDATAAELTPSLPEAEAQLRAAQEGVTAAEVAYHAGLVGADDAQLEALDAARRAAGTKVDRAQALLSALRGRLAEAQEREAEAQRVEHYEAARRQADDAAAALAEMWPVLAGGIAQLIEGIALAEAEVAAVNSDLPKGAVPLQQVERRVRDGVAYEEEILEETTVERWVQVGHVKPASFPQENVRPIGGGRGVLPMRGLPYSEGRQMELRRFVQQRFFPAYQGRGADKLATVLHLPALREGDPDFFRPVARDANGIVTPRDVLHAIAKLRGIAPRGEPTRAVELRLVPLDETPVRAPPSPPPYRPQGAPLTGT